MINNFAVNLTHSIDDTDRTTVAMIVANAAIASGKNTVVFLASETVRLATKGVADGIHEEALTPMIELVRDYLAAAGAFWVCPPCFNKCGDKERNLIVGSTLAGGPKLVVKLGKYVTYVPV